MRIMTDTSNYKPIPIEIQSDLMFKISHIAAGISNVGEIMVIYRSCLLEWLDEIDDNEKGSKISKWPDAQQRDMAMLHMLEQNLNNTLVATDVLIDYVLNYEQKIDDLNSFLEAIPTQIDKDDHNGRKTEKQTQQP
jgi:hypothetical protein